MVFFDDRFGGHLFRCPDKLSIGSGLLSFLLDSVTVCRSDKAAKKVFASRFCAHVLVWHGIIKENGCASVTRQAGVRSEANFTRIGS